MLAAGAIFAVTPITKHQFQNSSLQINEESVRRNSKLSIIGEHSMADKNMAPTKSGEIPKVIREPEGNKQIYSKACAGWFYESFIGMLMSYEYENSFSAIYYSENNVVFFEDIIPVGFTTYTRAELSEDKITMSLPQTLEFWEEDGYGINLCVLKLTEDGTSYEYDPSIDTVTFTILPDTGTIKLNLPGREWMMGDDWDPEYILGLIWTDDDSWSGYGEKYEDYQPFSDDLTIRIPTNINKEQCTFISNGYGRYVNVALDMDNNYIYIQGLCEKMPDGTVKAKYDPASGKAYIPQDEFLGLIGGNRFQRGSVEKREAS